MEDKQLVSRQYQMAAACEASYSHLELGSSSSSETENITRIGLALKSSQTAVDIYNSFGFVNIIECSCEEIFFRHSQALKANNQMVAANEYLEMAFSEMMRKYYMIPQESDFRRTYLENLEIHREIRSAYAVIALAKISESQDKK